jgi:hypothetical protein
VFNGGCQLGQPSQTEVAKIITLGNVLTCYSFGVVLGITHIIQESQIDIVSKNREQPYIKQVIPYGCNLPSKVWMLYDDEDFTYA